MEIAREQLIFGQYYVWSEQLYPAIRSKIFFASLYIQLICDQIVCRSNGFWPNDVEPCQGARWPAGDTPSRVFNLKLASFAAQHAHLATAKQPLPELITQSRFCPLSRGYIDDLAAKIWPQSHFLSKAKNVLTKMPNIWTCTFIICFKSIVITLQLLSKCQTGANPQ